MKKKCEALWSETIVNLHDNWRAGEHRWRWSLLLEGCCEIGMETMNCFRLECSLVNKGSSFRGSCCCKMKQSRNQQTRQQKQCKIFSKPPKNLHNRACPQFIVLYNYTYQESKSFRQLPSHIDSFTRTFLSMEMQMHSIDSNTHTHTHTHTTTNPHNPVFPKTLKYQKTSNLHKLMTNS